MFSKDGTFISASAAPHCGDVPLQSTNLRHRRPRNGTFASGTKTMNNDESVERKKTFFPGSKSFLLCCHALAQVVGHTWRPLFRLFTRNVIRGTEMYWWSYSSDCQPGISILCWQQTRGSKERFPDPVRGTCKFTAVQALVPVIRHVPNSHGSGKLWCQNGEGYISIHNTGNEDTAKLVIIV